MESWLAKLNHPGGDARPARLPDGTSAVCVRQTQKAAYLLF